MLETLDHTIRIGSTPTFLYFDLYLYSAYAAHYVYFNINLDLPESLSNWLNENILTLNYEKTKFLIFANGKHLKSYSNINIPINNQKIKQGKYLEITLREDLSWHDHIDNLITKINQRLGLLRRVKSYLPLDARCILYTSRIRPIVRLSLSDCLCPIVIVFGRYFINLQILQHL